MNAFKIDITGHGEEMLQKAFSIVEEQWKDHMFNHYSFREQGDGLFFVLHFVADDPFAKELPYAMTISQGCSLVAGWLNNNSESKINWRVFTDFKEIKEIGVGVIVEILCDDPLKG